MKGLLRGVVIFLLTIGAFACNDDADMQPMASEEYVKVSINDIAWTATPEMRLNQETDTLTIISIANQPNDEVLVMKLKFDGVGAYTLTDKQAYYYTTVGGDVFTSVYNLTPNSDGVLVVSAYDEANKLIQGSFRLTLKQKWAYNENDVELLSFTDGAFRGTVTD